MNKLSSGRNSGAFPFQLRIRNSFPQVNTHLEMLYPLGYNKNNN